MNDAFGHPIRVGDLCAVSARNGKHDSIIKLFYVQETLEETHPDYGTNHEYLRGVDGAGRFTQIQKASNIIVINGAIAPDNPRLKEILAVLSEAEVASLLERLT